MTISTQSLHVPESPYRGIESFRYVDQQIFSARDEETWDLLSNVLMYRGVLLYGDSGSGKTSLVNAGLIPAALKEDLIPDRLRIQPRLGKEFKLERISIESDGGPPYLPSTFVEVGSEEDTAATIELSVEEFWHRLARAEGAPSDAPRPLLILDQFEEFITLFEEALRGGETEEARLAQKEAPAIQQSVLKVITRLIETETLPIKVLFVFREDYLAKLEPLLEPCPQLLDQYVRLLPPRVEEAEKIVRAPFVDEELKERFVEKDSGKGGKEIPSHLAAAIAVQLSERSEGGFLNLSELQIVCRQLWESPDPVKFFEEKGRDIQKVLEDYWAEVLKKLGELYDPAIALLSHMVTASNTRNIISEPDLKSHEGDSFTSEQIEKALEGLVERKLVRREPRHKIYFYEIASEFLVPWIQAKKATRGAEMEARRLAAETEKKLKQSEKEKRVFRISSVALGLAVILAVVAGVILSRLLSAADKARKRAEVAEGELETEGKRLADLIGLLRHLSSTNSKDRLQFVQELNDMIARGEIEPELAPVFLATIVDDKDPAVSKAASALLPSATQQANKGFGESLIKSAETNQELKLPPRAYIQIADDDQRPRADKIAAGLKAIGFVVPAYEKRAEAPAKNQLRYYKSAEGPDPYLVLGRIRAADPQYWEPVALPPSGKVRRGHFEIWFARSTPPATGPTGKGTVSLTILGEPFEKVSVNYRTRGDEPEGYRSRIYEGKLGGDGRLTIAVPRASLVVHGRSNSVALDLSLMMTEQIYADLTKK